MDDSLNYSYSSLNSYKSAISSIHEHIEGILVGQHPQAACILEWAYNLRPPTPQYSHTWKVSTMVARLDSIQLPNTKLPFIDFLIRSFITVSY